MSAAIFIVGCQGDGLKPGNPKKGIAFFSLGTKVNLAGIDYATAKTVIDRVIFAKKKLWNLDVIVASVFDGLPADVKETNIQQYRKKTAGNYKGVAHN